MRLAVGGRLQQRQEGDGREVDGADLFAGELRARFPRLAGWGRTLVFITAFQSEKDSEPHSVSLSSPALVACGSALGPEMPALATAMISSVHPDAESAGDT